MNLQIEKAAAKDIPQVVALIKEFAEFEKLSHLCEVTENDLLGTIFGAQAFVRCLIAKSENELVGYAIFYPVFKSFRGERSVFLEDLYVTPDLRGKGLGFVMFREVAKYAREQGFGRLDWQALKWNKPAIDFYKNLGADSDDDNFDFRLRGAAFEKLAQ